MKACKLTINTEENYIDNNVLRESHSSKEQNCNKKVPKRSLLQGQQWTKEKKPDLTKQSQGQRHEQGLDKLLGQNNLAPAKRKKTIYTHLR